MRPQSPRPQSDAESQARSGTPQECLLRHSARYSKTARETESRLPAPRSSLRAPPVQSRHPPASPAVASAAKAATSRRRQSTLPLGFARRYAGHSRTDRRPESCRQKTQSQKVRAQPQSPTNLQADVVGAADSAGWRGPAGRGWLRWRKHSTRRQSLPPQSSLRVQGRRIRICQTSCLTEYSHDASSPNLYFVKRVSKPEPCYSATLITSFPKFSPRNSLSRVSGKVSSPSTTSSRALSLPSIVQPARAFMPSAYRSA